MDLAGWNQRYAEHRADDLEAQPTPLLIETAQRLSSGQALDLASGSGRNAIWLAQRGWQVTALEGAETAIRILQQRATDCGVKVDAQVVDLSQPELKLGSQAFDLVAILYYLQRDLFPRARSAVKPGGTLLAIAHTTEGSEQPNANRLRPGELREYFEDWHVAHYFEGKPSDPAHKRAVAEIVAIRPKSNELL